jgi:acid phosphatase type 7
MDELRRRVAALASRRRIAGWAIMVTATGATAALIGLAQADVGLAKGGSAAPRSRPAVMTVASAQTTPGSRFSVSGTGLHSHQVARLLLGRRRLVRFRARRGGDWTVTARIPRRTPAGPYPLRVLASGRQVIAVSFRITAKPGSSTILTKRSTGERLQLWPNRAPAGSRVALAGSGFRRHQTLALRLDSVRLAGFTATSTGALRAFVRVPSTVRPGPHLLSLLFGRVHLDLGVIVTTPAGHTPPSPPPSAPTSSTPTTPIPATTPTGTPPTTTTTTTTTPAAPDPVVVAAGDLACSTRDPNVGGSLSARYPSDNCEQQAVAKVATAAAPNAFLTLGDNENGPSPNYSDTTGVADFQQVYAPTFGRLNDVVYPEVGNADYSGSPLSDSGFMQYFQNAGVISRIQRDGGDNSHLTRGMYYSFNLGTWHIIALNTQCSAVGGCGTGSPEEAWLHADLAAHPAMCTLAYWHIPLWNSVSTGRDTSSQAFWADLYAAHSDVILNAHGNNHYENFVPLSPTGTAPYGTADRTGKGIREFIVSNGGYGHGYVSPAAPTTNDNGSADNYTSFGVLKLTLHPGSYDWQFLNAADSAASHFRDSGHGSCH